MRDDYLILEELGPEKLQQIIEIIKKTVQEKPARTLVEKVSGGQERLLKLQLRAFERIPSEIIVKYMTEEERQEYEILGDAYL